MTAKVLSAADELFGGAGRPTDERDRVRRAGGPRAGGATVGRADAASDDVLVTLARGGDGVAFRTLVERHQKRVFQLILSIVKDPEAAMDLVQDTFVKIHNGLPAFKGDAAFSTWIHRIACNLAFDARRREAKRTHVACDEHSLTDEALEPDPYAAGSASPQKACLRRELSEELQRALSLLSEPHRAILILREVEGLSYEELAETLEIPKGTVMSRLFHARQKLQSLLRPYVSDDPASAVTSDRVQATG